MVCSRSKIVSIVQQVVIKTHYFLTVVLLCYANVVVGVGEDRAHEKLNEIIVEGDPRDVPTRTDHGSLSVLESQDLQLIRPRHPHELFTRTTGIWVSKNSGQEHLTGLRSGVLSGAGACGSYLLLEDNIPTRPIGLCNVNGLFELNIEQADRIEVLRGPASAIFGGNALRGVINVRPFVGSETQSFVSLETGGYDYRQVRVSGQLGKLQTKFHSTDTNGFRDDTGYAQQKLNASWTANVGNWEAIHSVSVTNLEQETGGYLIGYRAFENKLIRTTNPNPEAFRDAKSIRLYSQLNDNNRLYIYPYARFSTMSFLQHFLPGQPNEHNEQRSVGVVLLKSLSVKALSLELGAQLDWMRASLVQHQQHPTVGSAFLRSTRPIGTHYDFSVTGTTAAIFNRTSLDWHDSHEVELSWRLEQTQYRYENHHLDGNSRDDGTPCGFGGCLYTRPSDRTDQFTNIAGRGSYLFRPTETFSFWILTAWSYRPPQITELYRLQSGQVIADLDSEQAQSTEVGWQTTWQNIDLSISTYVGSNSPLIFRDANGMNVSDGATVGQGLEIELRWQVSKFHELHVASTFAKHEYDFTRELTRGESIIAGNQVDTSPQALVHTRWTVHFGTRGRAELEMNRIGAHYLDAANSARYDGHNVVNFRIKWRLNNDWTTYGRILNVHDAYFADRADFAFGNYRYFPAETRQFFVGIQRNFGSSTVP